MSAIPTQTKVLVVGGGPAGSTASAALANEGWDVVCLEADHFPRYHIGESMIPSIIPFLRFTGAYDKVAAHGFHPKRGATFQFGNAQGRTDFSKFDPEGKIPWNVTRSEFDEILLRHAQQCGAKVFEGVKVEKLVFTPDPGHEKGRPVAAHWKADDKTSGVIKFDFVIDASGRAGILGPKHLKNRNYHNKLKNVATWAYFEHPTPYEHGDPDWEDSPYFEALTDESGWVWFIPLAGGKYSVGVVRNQDHANKQRKALGNISSKDFFLEGVKMSEHVWELLKPAKMISEQVQTASDYSFASDYYAIPGARMAGDSGCFIDPLYSSGMHMATLGGLSAAASICSSVRGDCTEQEACDWHTTRIKASYTRFLVIVLTTYKQMQNQGSNVMRGEGEEDYSRAFDFFRPIIQGSADAGSKISNKELADSMKFCDDVTENERRVKNAQGQSEVLDTSVLEGMDILDDSFGNYAKNTHAMFHDEGDTSDAINGRSLVLERGSLGLKWVGKRQGPKIIAESADFGAAIPASGKKKPSAATAPMIAEKKTAPAAAADPTPAVVVSQPNGTWAAAGGFAAGAAAASTVAFFTAQFTNLACNFS